MIVTLTGYMGSGKSTVGRILSSLLGCGFTDLDEYIGAKIGRSPAQILREDGEVRFRAIEAEALRDLVTMHQLTGKDTVIALGGGTIMTVSLRRLILEDTICVYLQAAEESLRDRIGSADDRPLACERFTERLHERLPVYEKAAITVATDGKSPEDVADEIRLELKKRTGNEL